MIWEEKVSRDGAEQRWTQAPGCVLDTFKKPPNVWLFLSNDLLDAAFVE